MTEGSRPDLWGGGGAASNRCSYPEVYFGGAGRTSFCPTQTLTSALYEKRMSDHEYVRCLPTDQQTLGLNRNGKGKLLEES